MQNFANENEFDLHKNEPVEQKHLNMNGFPRLKARFDSKAKGNSERTY